MPELHSNGMVWQPNTRGGHSQVRVDDTWDEAPDRHEDCRRQARAAITAYEAAKGGVGVKPLEPVARQIIHELAADIRDRLSHEEGSANWRNAQRIVELSRPVSALTSPASGERDAPAGYVLVPVEPTLEMRVAGANGYVYHTMGDYAVDAKAAAAIYRTMLAAALLMEEK